MPVMASPGPVLGLGSQALDPETGDQIQGSETRSMAPNLESWNPGISDIRNLEIWNPALEVSFIDVRSGFHGQADLGGECPWFYPIYAYPEVHDVLYT